MSTVRMVDLTGLQLGQDFLAFKARVEHGLREGRVRALFDEVVAGTRDPYSAAAAILPVISLERP